jgi:hypothetical protein
MPGLMGLRRRPPDRAPVSLRQTLETVASRPADDAGPGPHLVRRRVLVAGRLVAAVAILAIVASGVYLYGSSRTSSPSPVAGLPSPSPLPSASTQTSASPNASLSASPSLQPTVMPLAGSSWQLVGGALPQMLASSWGSFRSPIFSLPGGGFLAFVPSTSSVTHASGDAILAVSKPAGPTAPPTSWTTRVFDSADGVSWRERSILPSDGATVTGAAESDGRVVVVGLTGDLPNETAMAWTSPDRRSWQASELPHGAFPEGVTAGPAGFLAWGFGENGTGLWSSPDGLAWQSITTSGLPADARADALFRVPGGYAISGTLPSGQDAVWQSRDAATWAQTWTGPAASGLTSYGLGSIVRAQNGGYISFGWVYTGTGLTDPGQELLIWTSRDGATWTLSDRMKPPGWTNGFAFVPGGYVTAGAQPSPAVAGAAPLGSLGVWTSPNGRTWQPLIGLPSVGPIEVLSVVGDGAHAVVVCVDQAGAIQLLVGDGLR